jgi:hypothetical protein
MTCRQWSGFVVLGSVLVLSGTPGCARKLAPSSPGAAGSKPFTIAGVFLGALDHASADAERQARDKADGVRASQKVNNDKQRRPISAGAERLDRGLPTSTSGTATAAGTNWSVVVTTPPPALDDSGREPAVGSGTLESTSPSHRYRTRSGLGLTAAMAMALTWIAAIVVAPKFLDNGQA